MKIRNKSEWELLETLPEKNERNISLKNKNKKITELKKKILIFEGVIIKCNLKAQLKKKKNKKMSLILQNKSVGFYHFH